MYDNVISGGFFFHLKTRASFFQYFFSSYSCRLYKRRGKMENHKRNRIIMHNGSKIVFQSHFIFQTHINSQDIFKCALTDSSLKAVRDFFSKLGMKRCLHLVEISIFSLNHDIDRPTKIINRADKNWAHFQKTKYLKNQSFQKISFIKVDLLV